MKLIKAIRRLFERIEPKDSPQFTCPCCGYITLTDRGKFDICVNCFWEDDGNEKSEYWREVASGPNHVSLREAQLNFLKFGACEERCVEFVGKYKHRKYQRDETFKLLPPVDLTNMELYQDMSNPRTAIINGEPVLVGEWKWRKAIA